MNSLYRELAPVPDAAWEQIETEASQALKRTLAARQLVDFEGPLGWRVSSVDPGRTQALESAPHPGVEMRMRKVQPLVELRIPFELARSEIDAIDRGAADADLQPVIDAARTAALAEDNAIFYGYRDGGITGICEAAAARSLPLTDDYTHYPDVVAEALNRLRMASVDGPLCDRPGTALLHRAYPDAGCRLSRYRACSPPARWPHHLGAGRRRGAVTEPAWR